MPEKAAVRPCSVQRNIWFYGGFHRLMATDSVYGWRGCWQLAFLRHFDVVNRWYNLDMREIPISKFKATCLATLAEVRRSRVPVRVTRFGKPVADIVPTSEPAKRSLLGC